MAERIQLSRHKGWRMPENTVKVDRSTRWGNPFIVEREAGHLWDPRTGPWIKTWSVRCLVNPHHDGALCPPDFRTRLPRIDALNHAIAQFREVIAPKLPTSELRGRNLACWCPLDQPCHADVLLELANREGEE